ncbi:Cell number regulator 8 [Capsicum annuum]|uniref:cell number regulator 8 n=1 Tax=Capsicum annuum TaxID=4072 RepID=UPI001FB15192|nr:cell number regulator 8 [Capsicum annuum]KAF3678768.1 Cell number regulator 8 [Capsicum annuum]
MANTDESNPLLPNQQPELKDDEKTKIPLSSAAAGTTPVPPFPVKPAAPMGWTADGVPVVEPMIMRSRDQWDSGLCACFGRTDDFCSSDIEVCLLGSVAPCVLYGSNAERLGSTPGTFVNHCLPYTGLYLIGQSFFGSNCVAPCFTYPSRTAIRRKFNLEGNCEALNRSCGCCGSFVEDEMQREQCESVCDFATHFFCHPCALCQEGRELRRRLPHPGFNAQQVLVMIPPNEQTMGR